MAALSLRVWNVAVTSTRRPVVHFQVATTTSSDSPESLLLRSLQQKPLGELRALGRRKGIRAETKADLIRLLLNTSISDQPPPAAGLSNGAPAVTEAVSAPPGVNEVGPPSPPREVQAENSVVVEKKAKKEEVKAEAKPDEEKQEQLANLLRDMPLGQLRYLARERGLRGDKQEELIKMLISEFPTASVKFGPSRPVMPPVPVLPLSVSASPKVVPSSPSTDVGSVSAESADATESAPAASSPLLAASVAAAAPAAPADSADGLAAVQEAVKLKQQLMGRSIAQLRAMARQRGIRGDTKAELVSLLLSVTSMPDTVEEKQGAVAPPPPSPLPVVEAKAQLSPSPAPSSPAALSPKQTVSRPLALAEREMESIVPDAELPPFESEVVQRASEVQLQLLQEIASLKAALEAVKAKEHEAEEEKESMLEQADFLRNLLIGGVGLAAVPLISPLNVTTTVTAPVPTVAIETAVAPAAIGAAAMSQETILAVSQTTSLLEALLQSQESALAEIQALVPLLSPALAPEVRQLEVEKFCLNAVEEVRGAAADAFCKSVNVNPQ